MCQLEFYIVCVRDLSIRGCRNLEIMVSCVFGWGARPNPYVVVFESGQVGGEFACKLL